MIFQFNKDCTACEKLPSGCSNYAEPTLIAAAGEVWYMPRDLAPPPLTYLKMDCCGTISSVFSIGGIPATKPSTFSISFSGITNNSKLRVCYVCDGISFMGSILSRSDYPSDADFLDAIAIDFIATLGLGSYSIGTLGITFEWDGAYDDCKCTSFVYGKQVATVGDLNTCNAIISYTQYQIGLNPTICFNSTIYRNNITVSLLELCMETTKQPECIDNNTEYVSIAFPHKFKGCMRIASGASCTSPIEVRPSILSSVAAGAFPEYKGYRVVCNTIWIQARNVGENWTAFRIPAIAMTPQAEVSQKVYKTPRGSNIKLYASREVVWSFQTDLLDFFMHKYIMGVLEKDFVYIEGVFDTSYQTTIKQLVSNSDYKIEYLDNSTKSGNLGFATFTMKEKEYSYVNDYLQ